MLSVYKVNLKVFSSKCKIYIKKKTKAYNQYRPNY